MIPYDEVMLMSLFATTKQKIITQQISTSYRVENPKDAKAAISDAAWQGFVAGCEATKRYYENKEKKYE